MESLAKIVVNLVAAVVLAVSLIGSVQAQDNSQRTVDELSLPLYKSGILNLDKSPSQISVGNPGIADILILKGTQVHVVAKALGSTNVVFWDRSGTIFASVDIEVTHDLDSLKQKLHTLLPNEKIGVHSAQEKIILNGSVSSPVNMSAALELADSYLPECIDALSTATDTGVGRAKSDGKTTNNEGCKKASVVNLMSVGGSQQVMLEVKIAEMSRTFMRSLDSNLNLFSLSEGNSIGAINGATEFPNVLTPDGLNIPVPVGDNSPTGLVGPVVDQLEPVTPTITNSGISISTLSGNNYLQAIFNISRSKGLSKVLAEPNLTTLTGRPAKFVSGGEFPISVVNDNGGIDIEYKEFGVIVDFLPTILDDARISLDLDIGVSELSQVLANGFPIITKRGASSTVELKNGQTIGIAGLIQDEMSETAARLPGLGDIPILGTLFRSQAFQSEETELVMFVTPHLAKPISPDLIRLPTDSFIPPNDFEFYVLGKMASFKKPEAKSYRKTLDGGFDGVKFGHNL